MSPKILESGRLKLIQCDEPLIHIVLKGDEAIAGALDIAISPEWTSFGRDIFEYTLKMIQNDPESVRWGAYISILKEDNILIGSCGIRVYRINQAKLRLATR